MYQIALYFLIVFITLGASSKADTRHFNGVNYTYLSAIYIGIAKIDGVKLIDNEDEIGVFVNDTKGKLILAGACVVGDVVPSEYLVHIYGDAIETHDIKEGAVVGDELIFKIWDKSEQKEIEVPFLSMRYDYYWTLTRPENSSCLEVNGYFVWLFKF
ncbi:MAG: hypothetical protein OMM_12761 [Candidatus Magnetoglobus multicellularis str. Araruama]|uniref:Uncharacterized protein n=1 Tax=Candidatus Magnetoglobus multicellularis str. Araruama TaxID=890399 RepID=A0A1V1NV61_9BACT|nr:MAG: hypothetical protein OMM_12761 [Candidatus Magnetoglobus multicellularis str. Araruama]